MVLQNFCNGPSVHLCSGSFLLTRKLQTVFLICNAALSSTKQLQTVELIARSYRRVASSENKIYIGARRTNTVDIRKNSKWGNFGEAHQKKQHERELTPNSRTVLASRAKRRFGAQTTAWSSSHHKTRHELDRLSATPQPSVRQNRATHAVWHKSKT